MNLSNSDSTSPFLLDRRQKSIINSEQQTTIHHPSLFTMNSPLRPQSLPCNISYPSCFEPCLPDLQEEFYSYPADHPEVDNKNSDTNVKQIISDRSLVNRSPPLPIPSGPSALQAEREEELYQELVHVYNDSTWKMYHRIQNARKAQLMKDRSQSMGDKPRSVNIR